MITVHMHNDTTSFFIYEFKQVLSKDCTSYRENCTHTRDVIVEKLLKTSILDLFLFSVIKKILHFSVDFYGRFEQNSLKR
jgi:hypothetical protein